MSEAELERAVRDLLKLYGLHGFHAHDSRRSAGPGYPDWTICGVGGLIFRELKSDVGQLSPEQRRWRNVLQAAGADWSVWRPADLQNGRIEREMRAVAAGGYR